MSSKILITGSGGFLGRHLADYLSSKHHVVACSRSDLNMNSSEAVERIFKQHQDIETVIHCATTGGGRLTGYDEGRADVVEQNLRMFFNLVRCLRKDQRLIIFGSGVEYDRIHCVPKIKEEYFDSYVPNDAYGFAKYCISKIIAQCDNIICLRIFGVYGSGEDYRYKFISNSIVKGLLGLPITIAQNVIFDYLYIKDLVEFIEKLLSCNWPYRHMNITPTESIDLFSVAKIVNAATGNQAGIEIRNQGWNTEYTGDNKRLLEVAGDYAFTPYSEGIVALTEYYRSVWASLDLDIVRADPYIDKCIVRL